MAATALLALVATGGLVSAKTASPPRHLLALGSHTPAPPAVTTTAAPVTTTTKAQPKTKAKPKPTTTTTAAPVPIPSVASMTPKPGASGVTTGTRIRVVLSGPARPGAPLPTLVPPVAGEWSVKGAALTFTPSSGYVPWSTVRVNIPQALARHKRWSFSIGPPPVLRVAQLLAELHYLPLRFVPTTGGPALANAPTAASLVPSISQIGSFSFRYPNVPSSLSSLWSAGQDNVITIGAIMHFEDGANLTSDGLVGPQVWKTLTSAVVKRAVDPSPYDYLMVSETLPEGLIVWQNGRDVYKSLANTGVPGATTATGTWPVYARFSSTTMVGTDPDGYHYSVTGVPWVAYFNGGDAVHGYWRYGYGYPQSNGCVELPVDNAQVVWGMDPIGTLVTVTS
jgi:lipoprotein-anchoring transpeptidase ErfK/SrfK